MAVPPIWCAPTPCCASPSARLRLAGLIAFGTRHPGYFHAGQGTELMSFLGRIIEFGVRSWLDLPKP